MGGVVIAGSMLYEGMEAQSKRVTNLMDPVVIERLSGDSTGEFVEWKWYRAAQMVKSRLVRSDILARMVN